MDVKALTYYVAIVDQKSINKAAEILYISQPVLSRTVQALEDELGVQLLIRTNHGIEMTGAGFAVCHPGDNYEQYIIMLIAFFRNLTRSNG